MTTALIEFGADSNAIETTNGKSGTKTVRLLTAKEFKEDRGLKGQAGKNAYNGYLREQGKANTGELARAMSTGELLVKGFQSSKNGLRVGFMYASAIKDRVPAVRAAKAVMASTSRFTESHPDFRVTPLNDCASRSATVYEQNTNSTGLPRPWRQRIDAPNMRR